MSNSLAPCPKCREMNAKISEECLFCGAPLPWAASEPVMNGAFAQPVYAAAGVAAAPIADPTGLEPKYRGYNPAEFGDPNDKPELWIAVVSFLFPLAGIVLYFSNSGRAPKRASSAARGMLWSMILSVALGLGSVLMARQAMEWASTGPSNRMLYTTPVSP